MDISNSNMALASTDITIYSTIREIIGASRTDQFSQVVLIPEAISSFGDQDVSRAQLSMSLFLVLYADLLERVPHALQYFNRRHLEEQTILLDHGAVRSVLSGRNGKLPAGEASLSRILIPLGYFHNHTYPLPKLRMTGRSYTHLDFPELIPQYFVSEFHPEKIEDDNFQKAVLNVIDSSIDPLDDQTLEDLKFLSENNFLARDRCADFLSNAASAFARQHEVPNIKSYETLLTQSSEMAWIATEGNSFNHATDRVRDVQSLAEQERDLGFPIKDTVEISSSENILQTAYKADTISRTFNTENDEPIQKDVPGSFFEFITRKKLEDGKLDLAFDASNATGIFAMTKEIADID
ncbi:MAG TPA: DUF1338 family protein [Acidimicrobiia bacterium]|nr:DUF1338 family protein [Acidimicrobiia bacterium]